MPLVRLLRQITPHVLLVLLLFLAVFAQSTFPPGASGGGGGGSVKGLTIGKVPKATATTELGADAPISIDPSTSAILFESGTTCNPTTLSFSATPTVDLATGCSWKMVLTANVTSISFTHPVAGKEGWLILTQDDPTIRTVTVPNGFCRISQEAGKTIFQKFRVKEDGTTIQGMFCSSDETPTEVEGPEKTCSSTTTSGRARLTFCTGHYAEYYANNSANRMAIPRIASGNQVAVSDLSDGTNLKKRIKVFYFHGGGNVLTTGLQMWAVMESPGTFTSQQLVCNETNGSIVIDLFKAAYAAAPPTSGSIVASAKPTLSTAQRSTNTDLAGSSWTTTFSTGDYVRPNIDSASVATACTLALYYTID